MDWSARTAWTAPVLRTTWAFGIMRVSSFRTKASTIFILNRRGEDWRKVFGDTAAVTALLNRLFDHALC